MPKLTVVDPKGATHVLDGPAGENLMFLIRDAGLPMLASCGGFNECGTCHVYVSIDHAHMLGERTETEKEMLLESSVYDERRSRLSCQIIVTDAVEEMTVEMPRTY